MSACAWRRGLLDEIVPVALVEPGVQAPDEGTASLCRRDRSLAFLRLFCVVILHRRFARGEFLLDSARLIAAGARQVLLRVGQQIRVEGHLRIGNVQILGSFGRHGGFGVGSQILQALNTLLVGVNNLLQLLDALREDQGIAGEPAAIYSGQAQRRGEGLIYFVIREAFSLFRELHLFSRYGERRQSVSGLPGAWIDIRVLVGVEPARLGPLLSEEGKLGHRVTSRPGEAEAQNKHHEQACYQQDPCPTEHPVEEGAVLSGLAGGAGDHGHHCCRIVLRVRACLPVAPSLADWLFRLPVHPAIWLVRLISTRGGRRGHERPNGVCPERGYTSPSIRITQKKRPSRKNNCRSPRSPMAAPKYTTPIEVDPARPSEAL